MCVNLLGNPNDFDAIKAMICDKNIILLEDNCESMGAEYKGKQAGTFGIMGTINYNLNKLKLVLNYYINFLFLQK